ncbi:MAG: hypothetical protein WC699_16000 [Bacteroidales bacterium]|jgi:hypothetical protein
MITLNLSWLHGKYVCGEIDSRIGTVQVYDVDFFAQGEEAFDIIEQIRRIWIERDMSVEQAFMAWISMYL